MLSEDQITIIKDTTKELLEKMTVGSFSVDLKPFFLNEGDALNKQKIGETISVDIKLQEPQALIGQNGNTLFELQRVLRIILNKKLQKNFYVKLDINDYQKRKEEHLKNLAHNIANEVSLTKEKKVLSPMPAYERRIIHAELSWRKDVATESQGEGGERFIVIIPVV